MIHKEPLASYLKRRVFLGALGLSEGEPVVFSPLGQGEYNVNYSFIHPRTGKKLVLRINTGSQMHLEDQIGYEFTALQYLVPSGRTPKPLFCDREQGLLVMEWLPGRTLDYKTDMDEAAGILRKKRMERGAVDFDFAECKILLDEKGRPEALVPRERNAATMLIEDFMLAANETVAEDYYWQQIPFLYRTHEKPDEEKIRRFAILINNFGYSLHIGNGEVHPKEIQKLLSRAAGTPEEAMLSRLALRSMKQAKYTTDCVGHFGLAARYYTHFTSPIRRYPDLQIHRIIKENLHGRLGEKRLSHYGKLLPEAAVWTSSRERLAEEAERETEKAKKVQYMERRIGEVFDGVISGISNYGFYVELPDTVEGMVHVSELDGDYYVFDEAHYELVGERTRKRFKLGQPIRVQVVAVDRYLKTIDFLPVREF